MPLDPNLTMILCCPEQVRARICPGSVLRACSGCGCLVWLAPSSVAMCDAGKAQPVCPECLPSVLKVSPTLLPGAAEEVRDFFREDVRKPRSLPGV